MYCNVIISVCISAFGDDVVPIQALASEARSLLGSQSTPSLEIASLSLDDDILDTDLLPVCGRGLQ